MTNNFFLVEHALVKRDITILRDKNTQPYIFRDAVKRLSNILAVEISKNFELTEFEVETPLEKTIGFNIKKEIVLVPVLRAGLGMVSGFLEILTEAKVGHIGIQRNEETLVPVEYYYKTPKNINSANVILLDPMLGTGGSASQALKFLKKQNVKKLIFASLVASPEGLTKIKNEHPDVVVYTAALDRELNENGYILPGLGDAGDRIFGTI